MRQLATITDERAALRFADFLLTKGIAASVEPNPSGWTLWIHHEDHLEAARREFEQFTSSPDAPAYRDAEAAAARLRAEEQQRTRKTQKNVIHAAARWQSPLTSRSPVTLVLMVVCIATAFLSRLGDDPSFVTRFSIVQYEVDPPYRYLPLEHVWHQEPWRIVTPIFLHFGLMHLVFNMLMLFQLGAAVETVRGSWRFAILVLTLAVSSNLAQYVWSGPTFGGMSGVVYGLFGYIWMKSRFEPSSGFYISRDSVIILIGWFVLCMTGVLGGIANAAHAGGLVVGMAIGRMRSLWRVIR